MLFQISVQENLVLFPLMRCEFFDLSLFPVTIKEEDMS